MELISYDRTTKYITDECLKIYEDDGPISAMELTMHLLKFPEMKMHCPQHHYLVPAAMLTSAYKAQGRPIDMLRDDLMEAMMRAKNVLPGFCGLYGSCGAAVGLGIFASILTDTTPYSVEAWALTNRIVAGSLMKMAETSGPRCCKRSSYVAVQHAEEFVKEHYGLDLGTTKTICCEFSDQNPDCKRKGCPFFSAK